MKRVEARFIPTVTASQWSGSLIEAAEICTAINDNSSVAATAKYNPRRNTIDIEPDDWDVACRWAGTVYPNWWILPDDSEPFLQIVSDTYFNRAYEVVG